jgi:membrane dipeptidase
MDVPLDELGPPARADAPSWLTDQPAVTVPELHAAGVRYALGTIFTEPAGDGPEGYDPASPDAAHDCGMVQLNTYERWERAGLLSIVRRLDFDDAARDAPLALGILIENADPVRDPDELDQWAEHGVVAVGLTWSTGSRYAAGNAVKPGDRDGLTDMGEAMVDAIDALRLVHDISHLSQRATEQLLERTSRPVISSHSNCRELLGGDAAPRSQRHLADETIREVARRGGVLGLNLAKPFITAGLGKGERPTIDAAVDHIERMCELVGSRAHVGLGSDLDGGFSGADLPQGIDRAQHLHLLADALARRGWSSDDVAGFTSTNWLRFWRDRAAEHRHRA